MLDERLQDQLCIRTHSPLILIRLYIFYAEALTLASFDFIDFLERMLKWKAEWRQYVCPSLNQSAIFQAIILS